MSVDGAVIAADAMLVSSALWLISISVQQCTLSAVPFLVNHVSGDQAAAVIVCHTTQRKHPKSQQTDCFPFCSKSSHENKYYKVLQRIWAQVHFVQWSIPLHQVGTTNGPHPACEHVISDPRTKLKCTRNLSWMMEILWQNLDFIELLTILKLQFLILDFQKFRS